MNTHGRTRGLKQYLTRREPVQKVCKGNHLVPRLTLSLEPLLDEGSGVRVSLSGEESLLKPGIRALTQRSP